MQKNSSSLQCEEVVEDITAVQDAPDAKAVQSVQAMEPAEAVHEINEIHTDHPASERHESELPAVESPRSEANSEAAK